MTEQATTAPAPQTEDSFASNAMKRIPRVLIPYIAGSWGMLQFTEWIVNRYVLSPFLVDLCIYLCILLLPGTLVLAYYRGIPGPNPWTRAEKIGLPANAVVAAAVVFVAFHGKDLGAATKTVTVKDQNGQDVQRQIPKAEFRKRMALFFFENRTGDPKLNWVQQGLVELLELDLAQDSFVHVASAYNFIEKLKKAGLNEDSLVPLPLKQELARASNLDYMAGGLFSLDQDSYVVDVHLYKTKQGKRITERRFRGKDLFQLVDEISVQLKKDLDIPTQHIESVSDLPVKEITTESLEALRELISGVNVLHFKNDYAAAVRSFERALTVDPTFVLARITLVGTYEAMSQLSKEKEQLEIARKQEYKLPERLRFGLKYGAFVLNKEPDQAFNVLNQWVTLYPDDVAAYERLALFYQQRNQLEKSTEVRLKILDLDRGDANQLTKVAVTYSLQGDNQKALEYFQKYLKEVPQAAEGYVRVAATYERLTKFEEAKSYYQQALARDQDNVDSFLGLASVQMRLGEFTLAEASFEKTLQHSRSPQDKAKVYFRQRDYYRMKGQLGKALGVSEAGLEALRSFASPISRIKVELDNIELYMKTGQSARAVELVKAWERREKEEPDNFVAALSARIAYLSLYSEQGEGEKAIQQVPGLDRLISNYGLEGIRRGLFPILGKAYETGKDYDRAIQTYQQYVKQEPSTAEGSVSLGRSYRLKNDLANAETSLKRALQVFPAHPEAHYQLAVVYSMRNEPGKAREQLKPALETWADADPDFDLAKRARSLASTVAQR